MKPPIWSGLDLVRCPIHYGLCTDEKAYHDELRRMGVPEKDWPAYTSNPQSDACAHTLENKTTGKPAIIVCVRVSPKHSGIEVAALLVHEAVHIWQEVKDNIGEYAPSSEFEAYSIQTIAQELMWQYREQVIRRRRK